MELFKLLNKEVFAVQELNQGRQKPVNQKRNKSSVDHGQQTPENQKKTKTLQEKNSNVQIQHLCFDNELQKCLDTEISKEIICKVGADLQTCKHCMDRITLLQKAYTKLCFMCDIENPSIHDLYWNMDQVENTVHTSGLPAFASKRHIQDLCTTLQIRHEMCMEKRHFFDKQLQIGLSRHEKDAFWVSQAESI